MKNWRWVIRWLIVQIISRTQFLHLGCLELREWQQVNKYLPILIWQPRAKSIGYLSVSFGHVRQTAKQPWLKKIIHSRLKFPPSRIIQQQFSTAHSQIWLRLSIAVLPFTVRCVGQISNQFVRAFRRLKNVPIQSENRAVTVLNAPDL